MDHAIVWVALAPLMGQRQHPIAHVIRAGKHLPRPRTGIYRAPVHGHFHTLSSTQLPHPPVYA